MNQLALFDPGNDAAAPPPSPQPAARPGTARPPARSAAASRAQETLAVDPDAELNLEQLAARALDYAERARGKRTREAYATDWHAFERWCDQQTLPAWPASPSTLALYLTHLAAQGKKASTIRRARVAIGQKHAELGGARPDRDGRVRTLERGIARTHGAREQGAAPLLDHQLARAVSAFGDSPRDLRDRALLLVGFAGAFRASELVGLNVDDLHFVAGGVNVKVRRSKEDPLARGASTYVPRGTTEATCPVEALRRWIERVGRPTGPLFRVVTGVRIEHERIHRKAVSRAVQRAVERAGLEGHYSAHSLRSGLATAAYAHGASVRDIQLQGRWQDQRSVHRYVRLEHVPGRRSVVEGLL
jgi:site-specific recombinase XerD